MNSKCGDWKVLQLFKIAVIMVIFGASLSKVFAAQAQASSEPTIEERLAKVRELLKPTGGRIGRESDTKSSRQHSLETEQDKTIQAQQWPNYWNDWNNWSNWSDTRWNDWSNYWNDTPWNNWSNWGNY